MLATLDMRRDARDAAAGPGKFEGEAPIVALLWNMCLDGYSDEEGGDVEAAGFAYRIGRWVLLTDSQGFVYGRKFKNVKLASAEIEIIDGYAADYLSGD